MLTPDKTGLVVIDVQGKLAQVMHNREFLFENLKKLIKGVRVLKIPILWLEQNPAGLGPTLPEIAGLMPDITPISKMSFSACGNPAFMQSLEAADRAQLLLVGIEAHICVYQTAIDLLKRSYEVQVVADAVSSRTVENREVALMKMRDSGVGLTSVEMALFELLGVAEGRQFKEIAKIVK
ncbi:MAG: hydrolase [Pseudomonadota bacterium]